MDPGRGHDRGLLFSTFRTRLHEDDEKRRACGADDVGEYLFRREFRKVRIQMIDDIITTIWMIKLRWVELRRPWLRLS